MKDDHPKKRNKPTLVCTRCKRRKIKCNRELPCSSCINSNVGSECTYESKWQPVSVTKDEQKPKRQKGIRQNIGNTAGYNIQSMSNPSSALSSVQGKMTPRSTTSDFYVQEYVVPAFNPHFSNPVGPDDDMVNFHDGYTPIHVKDESRRLCFNPLCWASLLKKDPCLYKVCQYVGTRPTPLWFLMKSVPNFSQENINELSTNCEKQGKADSEFVSKLLKVEGYEELVPYKKLLTLRTNNAESKNKTDLSTSTLTSTLFDGKFDPELKLIENIKTIMPKKRVVWKLIDRFFETLYPFMPFVDKEYFTADMVRILGAKSYEDVPFEHMKIVKRLDLAHVAICLILLRFTYLSLFSNRKCINEKIIHSNDPSPTVQDMKYLFLNPVNVIVIEMAQLCLDRFEISRKTNLTVFQATLYMRVYHSAAPEDGDGTDGGDSQVSTAVLIQMAYALGLNREPNKFQDVCNDERINNLGRRMWHFLVRSDIIHCFHVGNPMSIDPKHYDVGFPYFTENNMTSDNRELEEAIAQTFEWFHYRLSTIRKIVDTFLDIQGTYSMNELTQTLNEVERVCREDFYTLSHVSSNNSIAQRFIDVINARVFIALKGSFLVLYHHIYLHYENKLRFDIMFFYFKKCYVIFQNDLLPYIFAVFHGKFSNDGLILNPHAQMAIHKFNQCHFAFSVRIAYKYHDMLKNYDHSRLMKEDVEYRKKFLKISNLLKNNKTIGNLMLGLMSKVSDRYFYAWRVVQAQKYLLSIINDPEFYNKIPADSPGINRLKLTNSQVDDMEAITYSLGKDLEAIVNYQDSVDIHLDTADYKSSGRSRRDTVVGDIYPENDNDNKTKTKGYMDVGSILDFSPAMIDDISPLQDFTYPNNEEIDQMWLLVMALKYDPVELISGDFDPVGYFNQQFQNTLSDRFETDPNNIMNE
ncbi:uncharacterized protein AC631_01079 [Debaryomyces fabryi]|uniref:Zn(2)-C6 fungal-type domain-containing protein n=1 Tax=Debaryomyces fabryi TaxID=58627 RepID=A0A0V1Q3S9_9ASCO|nr:uncharacterized protein AC631_01079 [Debaryomyces fabryi]KSA03182.1 hypothetical protein AC631_01079 [Debaryomyces fabryi]CUM48460.1 unnamed protein product [Debaryomyces fabryi]